MSKHFMGSGNKIIVATNFDNAFSLLRRDAEAIAERTGMNLRYVHAVERAGSEIPGPVLSELASLGDILEAVDTSRMIKADQMLNDALGPDFDPSGYSVLSGDPVRAITAYATCEHASLVMVGATGDNYRFVPKGLSTALRLMAASDIPVLVVPTGGTFPPNNGSPSLPEKDRLRMLIADDLSPEGQDVVYAALDLARGIGNVDVLHLNVSTLSNETFQKWIAELAPSATAFRNVDDITLSIRRSHEETLASRAPERIPLLEARGGTYRAEIVWGEPIEQITQSADQFEADIMVFGRHKMLHRKTFTIGKVPFSAMLQQKRLVMIVPPR